MRKGVGLACFLIFSLNTVLFVKLPLKSHFCTTEKFFFCYPHTCPGGTCCSSSFVISVGQEQCRTDTGIKYDVLYMKVVHLVPLLLKHCFMFFSLVLFLIDVVGIGTSPLVTLYFLFLHLSENLVWD